MLRARIDEWVILDKNAKSTTALDKRALTQEQYNQENLLTLSHPLELQYSTKIATTGETAIGLLGYSHPLWKGLWPIPFRRVNAIKCWNSVPLSYHSPGAGMGLWVGEAANPRWLPETGKALLTEDEVSCSIPTGLKFISFILRKIRHNQLCKNCFSDSV